MYVFQTLVEGKTFDSYEDIVHIIEQVFEEDHIYLRIDKSQTIASFNNRKDVSLFYFSIWSDFYQTFLL